MNRFKRVLSVFSTGVISMSSLFLLAPAVHAAADTCTWVGGGADANFTTAGNWSGCDNSNIPESGDALIFPSVATAYVANNNDLVGAIFTDITFNGTLATPTCNTNEYTISGNSFSVVGSFIFDHDGSCGIIGGYTVEVNAPYVNNGPTNLVDGTQSATFDRLRLNGGVTGSGTLAVRTAQLDVFNVNSTVNLGVEDGGWLGYQVGSCSGATISSQLTLVGQDNRLIIYDGSAACTQYTISALSLSTAATVAAGYEATATVASFVDLSSGSVSIVDGSTSKMIVNGQTLVGAYINTTVSTDESANPYTTAGKEIVTVTSTGKTGDFIVSKYGYLKGNGGTVGILTVSAGAFLAPGNSPGCLASGNLTLAGTYEVEVQGATACSGYDQTNVTGTVNLTGGTLDVATTAFVPTVGQTYTIINNDASDAVTGTFNGLTEGATIVDGGVTYTISYVGGDGNDVVLTVTAVNAAAIPGAPNTGFALVSTNPLATMLVTLLAVAGISYAARRQIISKK